MAYRMCPIRSIFTESCVHTKGTDTTQIDVSRTSAENGQGRTDLPETQQERKLRLTDRRVGYSSEAGTCRNI